MRTGKDLWLERDGEYWRLGGPDAAGFRVVNEYLSYLADRNYSPRTVRAYGFDLLNFTRWLCARDLTVAMITTDVLLQYLAACRQAQIPGRPGPNVVSLGGQRPAHRFLVGHSHDAQPVQHRLVTSRQLHHLIGPRVPVHHALASPVLLFVFCFFFYIFFLYHHLSFYFPTSLRQLVGCGRLGSGLCSGEAVVKGKNGFCYSFGYSSPWNTQRNSGHRNPVPLEQG